MNIEFDGIVVIIGNYGSGKTEVAINLAAYARKKGKEVAVADLDLVNPYFRSREAALFFKKIGAKSVIPDAKYLKADLPILTPEVAGIIRCPSELTILDAGGDDAGATVLAALSDVLADKKIKVLQVVNRFRPFTTDIKGCIKIRKGIERSSGLKVTGIVANTHLMNETRIEDIYSGFTFAKEVAESGRLALELVAVQSNLLSELKTEIFTCPVLPIERKLIFPWGK